MPRTGISYVPAKKKGGYVIAPAFDLGMYIPGRWTDVVIKEAAATGPISKHIAATLIGLTVPAIFTSQQLATYGHLAAQEQPDDTQYVYVYDVLLALIHAGFGDETAELATSFRACGAVPEISMLSFGPSQYEIARDQQESHALH